jgi:DNA-binding FadR family transcriptional regulator
VATALRVSVRLINRIAGHTARVDEHAVMYHAIMAGNSVGASENMRAVIDDVLLALD